MSRSSARPRPCADGRAAPGWPRRGRGPGRARPGSALRLAARPGSVAGVRGQLGAHTAPNSRTPSPPIGWLPDGRRARRRARDLCAPERPPWPAPPSPSTRRPRRFDTRPDADPLRRALRDPSRLGSSPRRRAGDVAPAYAEPTEPRARRPPGLRGRRAPSPAWPAVRGHDWPRRGRVPPSPAIPGRPAPDARADGRPHEARRFYAADSAGFGPGPTRSSAAPARAGTRFTDDAARPIRGSPAPGPAGRGTRRRPAGPSPGSGIGPATRFQPGRGRAGAHSGRARPGASIRPDGFPGQAWPAGTGRVPLGAPVALDPQANLGQPDRSLRRGRPTRGARLGPAARRLSEPDELFRAWQGSVSEAAAAARGPGPRRDGPHRLAPSACPAGGRDRRARR